MGRQQSGDLSCCEATKAQVAHKGDPLAAVQCRDDHDLRLAECGCLGVIDGCNLALWVAHADGALIVEVGQGCITQVMYVESQIFDVRGEERPDLCRGDGRDLKRVAGQCNECVWRQVVDFADAVVVCAQDSHLGRSEAEDLAWRDSTDL